MKKPVEFKIIPGFKERFLEGKGWNLKKFAEYVGYDEGQVANIINRKTEPSYPFLHRACHVLRCDLHELVQTQHYKLYIYHAWKENPHEKDNT